MRRLREHLETEPEKLPVNSITLSVAERLNLQLALDAVLAERETIGISANTATAWGEPGSRR